MLNHIVIIIIVIIIIITITLRAESIFLAHAENRLYGIRVLLRPKVWTKQPMIKMSARYIVARQLKRMLNGSKTRIP